MQLDTGLGIERGVIYAMFPGAVRSGHTHYNACAERRCAVLTYPDPNLNYDSDPKPNIAHCCHNPNH